MSRSRRVAATLSLVLAGTCCMAVVEAQEVSRGFDLQATLTATAIASPQLTEAPRSGSLVDAAGRAILYPTWKLSEHWSMTGALQFASRPGTYDSFSTQGQGLKGNVLLAALTYARTWQGGTLAVRVGELPTAFGSFPLRYDDTVNPLLNPPLQYGFYYSPVALTGFAGAQVDVTSGKWDGRAQFVNSSPANPRSLFDKRQFGITAAGFGYTVRQGLRIGASGYRGPYLTSQNPFYGPGGEADPKKLLAQALGLDVQWGIGHWNVQGEWQSFVFPHRAMPTFREAAGYAEVKRSLHPRVYAAVRAGYTASNAAGASEVFETAAGFRPNGYQTIRVGWLLSHDGPGSSLDKALMVQLVTSIHPLSLGFR